ncbi:nucleoid-associated protein [Pseudomonas sp. V1]|uniref:nucleoid-associated protein n=1 Tax=Pseudomonas arcuscaelestis TaxID=2710591 RepID=UPI00193F063B|nr:nucleoid-associated protein [Pseudomonas arcuscaelestis]MBM3107923.1 nucleoid-associated protein [Pseudomonas arcuscaelestis]
MDIKVNFAVVHELIKEQFKDIQPSFIRQKTFDVSKPAVSKLIVGATSIYGKKNNAAHYGIFAKKTASEFPEEFDGYTRTVISEQSFLEITGSAMGELHEAAKKATAASGGYILFVDYESGNTRFLLIAMLKKRDGLRLNEELEPEELIELDLSSLYHAARINFSKFEEYANADAEAKQELNYLSFLSQSAGRSAAGYFVTALGCSVGTASAAATKNLIVESVRFFRDRPNLYPNRIRFKDEVLRYLEQQRDAGLSVKLSEVEAIARQFFPAEMEGQADDLANEFTGHLNSEAVGVPVEFPISKVTLDKYTHVFYKADNWQLKFDRNSLGEGVDAEIRFVEKDRKLIINNLSDQAVEVIRQTLADKIDAPVAE